MNGILRILDENGTRTNINEVKRRLGLKENVIFVGTTAEWNALTAEQQNSYRIRILDDDFSQFNVDSPVVNVVAEDNDNAVSSGAVYNFINAIFDSHPVDSEYKENDEDYVKPASVQTGETFDSITQTYSDGTKEIYGIGILNRGEDNEVVSRLVYPDKTSMTFTGWEV